MKENKNKKLKKICKWHDSTVFSKHHVILKFKGRFCGLRRASKYLQDPINAIATEQINPSFSHIQKQAIYRSIFYGYFQVASLNSIWTIADAHTEEEK